MRTIYDSKVASLIESFRRNRQPTWILNDTAGGTMDVGMNIDVAYMAAEIGSRYTEQQVGAS
jgi:hypothetical protein